MGAMIKLMHPIAEKNTSDVFVPVGAPISIEVDDVARLVNASEPATPATDNNSPNAPLGISGASFGRQFS